MKLFREETPYLSKEKIRQLALAMTIITIGVYIIAATCSLLGSSYFILDFQSSRLDAIEKFFTDRGIMPMLNFVFSTIEFYIVLTFILGKFPRIWYPLAFYGIAVGLAFIVKLPSIVHTLYPFLFYFIIPIIEDRKHYKKALIRIVIAFICTIIFQALILMIKGGYFDGVNHIMNLASTFIYAIEYDIALSLTLYTASQYLDREKGDNNLWTIYQLRGGSSQTSRIKSSKLKQSPKRTLDFRTNN